jgi:hypothetical protein
VGIEHGLLGYHSKTAYSVFLPSFLHFQQGSHSWHSWTFSGRYTCKLLSSFLLSCPGQLLTHSVPLFLRFPLVWSCIDPEFWFATLALGNFKMSLDMFCCQDAKSIYPECGGWTSAQYPALLRLPSIESTPNTKGQ